MDKATNLDADACMKLSLYGDWISKVRSLAWPVIPGVYLPRFRSLVNTKVTNADAGDRTLGSTPCLYWQPSISRNFATKSAIAGLRIHGPHGRVLPFHKWRCLKGQRRTWGRGLHRWRHLHKSCFKQRNFHPKFRQTCTDSGEFFLAPHRLPGRPGGGIPQYCGEHLLSRPSELVQLPPDHWPIFGLSAPRPPGVCCFAGLCRFFRRREQGKPKHRTPFLSANWGRGRMRSGGQRGRHKGASGYSSQMQSFCVCAHQVPPPELRTGRIEDLPVSSFPAWTLGL